MSSHLEEFDRIFRTTKAQTTEQAVLLTDVREKTRNLLISFDTDAVACREKSIALTKLHEFLMWAAAAIGRDWET